jgi:hypothetical protein
MSYELFTGRNGATIYGLTRSHQSSAIYRTITKDTTISKVVPFFFRIHLIF